MLVRNECRAAEVLKEEKIPYTSLDFLFEKSRNFDSLTKNLLAEVKKAARTGDVCYCVEGSVTEDRAALSLMQKGANLIDGVSKSAFAAAAVGLSGGYTAVSAYELAEKKFSLPLVVYDLAEKSLASDLKLLLSEKIPEESEIFFLDGETSQKIPLYELDRMENYSPRCAFVVYETPLLQKSRFDFEDVVEILRRLRAPDGCPWDRVQTHRSIRINAIEEAYELVDAIDADDPDKIKEEAGDVLMQALFHTLIEEERGNFTLSDMLTALSEKLITRHTHVFGTDKAANAEGALSVWDRNKMKEKGQETYSAAVNDVPQCFPALLRAQKLCKRVEKGGWDKSTLENVKCKLDEEFEELKKAYGSQNQEKIYEELGDFLFSCAWLCRAVGVDGEMALLDAGKKLQKRYTSYESLVRADGKDPLALSKEERDFYYKRVKDAE